MISAQAQEMLDQLERAHNKMFLIMLAGFAMGFFFGLFAALMLVRH